MLENVVMDPVTRQLDLHDNTLAENSRGAYPIDFIPNASDANMGPVPRNIVMLTADAYGILPPIAKLTPDQAMYHFLSGYTARVAGTEIGVTEPDATFSTCFGAPFMVWDPNVYAKLLGDRIAEHDARVWLVNTGWTGGPYGTGTRMKIAHTRAMIQAALTGALDDVAKSGAILATTTSSLPVVECAAATQRPDDVVGMHFFNPASVMKLVEIVSPITTAPDVTSTVRAVTARIGKHPVLCGDRAGFIVNALLFPYLNDATAMLEANYATADDIDFYSRPGRGASLGVSVDF